MRIVRALLLVLLLAPATAPCCAEAVEACCPVESACAQGEACQDERAPVAPAALVPAPPLVEPADFANEPFERPAVTPDVRTNAPPRVPLRN